MKNQIASYLGVCILVLTFWGCGGDNGTTNQPMTPTLRITSINPTTVSRGSQALPFTVIGSGFTANVLVDLGTGIEVASKQVPDSQTIQLLVNVLPAASPGPRNVVVTAGTASARLDAGLTISDNSAPVADLFFTPSQGTPQTLFELDGSASMDSDGRVATYKWQISDGTNPTGMKVKKQFTQRGTYTVRLTVTDDKGGTSSVEGTIEVGDNKPPLPVLTITPGNGSQLTDFTFDAGESIDPDGEIRSYQWDLGGFVTNGKKVTHKFNQAGDYTILLEVKDSSGATALSRKTLSVVFFDRDQAKKEISDVIVDFLELFDDFEQRDSDDIVRGFSKSPGCTGRAKELSVIDNARDTVRSGSVLFLGPVDVPSVNDRTGNANITNRFYGEYWDGASFDGEATHYFQMVNEADGWKICSFFLVN